MRISDFERTQEIIRKDLQEAMKNGEVFRVVKLVETFSEVTIRINNIKSDSTVESILQELSRRYIGIQPDNGKKHKLIVFYDQVGTTICLGLQYLRGILAAGYEVVYIYENYRNDISPQLLNVIKSLNIEYKLFGPSTPIFKNGIYSGKLVSDFVNSLRPEKIVCHPLPNEAIGMSVMYSLPHIEKFIVVPGDHHYYAGFHSADYLIEFRKFGISVSINERGINAKRIYKLPYYPIIDELTNFKGFPVDTKGKVVFASAGATYKFVGSDIIYTLWKYILEFDNTLVLYMGKPDKKMFGFIKKNGYENRFILLGYRNDFVQCIKESDVLVNSYPVGGALVSQTAAYFEKPIIAYCDSKEYLFQNIADILGGDGKKDDITKTSLDETMSHVKMLLSDKKIRIDFGESTKSILQTKVEFDKTLSRILNHTEHTVDAKEVCRYDKGFLMDKYLCQQNNWHPTVFVPLLVHYGFSFFWKFKFMYKDMIKNPLYVSKFLCLYIYNSVKKR
jgi:hypothetical protein